MRNLLAASLCAVLLVALGRCAPAQAAGIASNCPANPGGPALVPTDLLRDALKGRGFLLEAWKIDGAGVMLELWSHEDGTWLVSATAPARCSWLVVEPGQEGGRLGDAHGLLRNGPLTDGAPA